MKHLTSHNPNVLATQLKKSNFFCTIKENPPNKKGRMGIHPQEVQGK
jgi:hypothetical protein